MRYYIAAESDLVGEVSRAGWPRAWDLRLHSDGLGFVLDTGEDRQAAAVELRELVEREATPFDPSVHGDLEWTLNDEIAGGLADDDRRRAAEIVARNPGVDLDELAAEHALSPAVVREAQAELHRVVDPEMAHVAATTEEAARRTDQAVLTDMDVAAELDDVEFGVASMEVYDRQVQQVMAEQGLTERDVAEYVARQQTEIDAGPELEL